MFQIRFDLVIFLGYESLNQVSLYLKFTRDVSFKFATREKSYYSLYSSNWFEEFGIALVSICIKRVRREV